MDLALNYHYKYFFIFKRQTFWNLFVGITPVLFVLSPQFMQWTFAELKLLKENLHAHENMYELHILHYVHIICIYVIVIGCWSEMVKTLFADSSK